MQPPLTWDDVPSCARRQLQHVATVPHTLVTGPEGCGKFAAAHVWLAAVFGPGAWQLHQRQQDVRSNGRMASIVYYASSYHVVLDPTLQSSHDRTLLSDFILGYATSGNVARFGQGPPGSSYKVVVVRSADRLSHDAQCALRDTMERCVQTCRIVFLARSASRLIDPLLSRTNHVRLTADPGFMLSRALVAYPDLAEADVRAMVDEARGSWRELHARALRRSAGALPAPRHRDLLARVAATAAKARLATHSKRRDELHAALVTCLDPGETLVALAAELLRALPAASHADVLAAGARAEYLMACGASPLLCLDMLYLRAAASACGEAV